MEVIIKFILGITIIAFVINFVALIGYITATIRDVIYKKYKINILKAFFYPGDRLFYSSYTFIGLLVIGNIFFLIVLIYLIFKTGNTIYSLF